MSSNRLVKLNKIREMSLEEMIGRGQQELLKLTDRFLVPVTSGMSESALYRKFEETARTGKSQVTSSLVVEQLRKRNLQFLPGLKDRQALVDIMLSRFPDDCRAIISAADRAMIGRFDLLGFEDLDFGYPIDWHLDPVSGDRAPLVHWTRIDSVSPIGDGDLKVYWEINRTAHFVTLGQAYLLTGDDRYVEEFIRQVISWIESNPAGMGIGWAASLDVAFRAISWLWALALCADSPKLTEHVVSRVLKSLIEHGTHIQKYLSHYFSPNTHLTGEALGLFYLGVVLPELQSTEKWRRTGLQILLDQLPLQVQKDGVYFEQASYYHRYTTDFYTHLLLMIRQKGIGISETEIRQLQDKLEGLYEHLFWIRRPDGTWPLFGDDDGGRLIRLMPGAANDFSDTMAVGAAIFKRGNWKLAAGEATSNLIWLLGADGLAEFDRLTPEKPRELSRSFESSGYVVMRDGWDRDSSFALIDCGHHGSAPGYGHAHSDALSIELAINGTMWLVDPATFVYGADFEMRDWFRSTKAHNTATVDGVGQSVTSRPFSWASVADCRLIEFADRGDSCVCSGSHDGYRRFDDPVIHQRSVLLLREKSVFIVSDQFTALKRHSYEVRYHFAPGCEVTASGGGTFEARNSQGDTLTIKFFVSGDTLVLPRAVVEDGWVSICYGQRVNAPVAVFEVKAEGPIEVTSVMIPQGQCQKQMISGVIQ